MITSGWCSATCRSSPRAPVRYISCIASQRVGANLAISQYWTSKTQGARRKVKREPPRTTADIIFPIASSPLSIVPSASGSSFSRSAAIIRAGRSCPSPMSAVRIRTRGSRDPPEREAPASSAPVARSLPFIEGFVPGIGSGGRVVHLSHSTYWRTPSLKGVSAFQPSSSRARWLEIVLPGKSPGGARRRVGDLAGVDVFLHPLGDFEDRRDLVAGEVVGASRGCRGERGDDPVGEVLDVDEAAGGAAIAGDRQRLSFEGDVGEFGDDAGGAGAGAVGDAEAQDRVLEAVELRVARAVGLARELGRGVEVARRRDRGFLVDLLLRAVAVDPGGRAV